MSGGAFDYVSSAIAIKMNIPSGTYGIGKGKYNEYEDDVAQIRRQNPMHDTELSELLYDMTCLLHSLEWYESGDTGEDTYLEDVKTFKEKWFRRDSEQTINSYKNDIKNFFTHICAELEEKSDGQVH